MRIIQIIILLLFSSLVFSQKVEKTIISEDDESTKYSISKYAINNVISEIWYCEEENKTAAFDDEGLFIEGLQRNSKIDSVLVYTYDENWNRLTTKSISNFNFNKFTNMVPDIEAKELRDQFNFESLTYECLGTANQIQTVEIRIKNNLPQNGWIGVSTSDKSLRLPKSKVKFDSRSTILFQVNVQIVPGECSYQLTFSNTNDQQRTVVINTVGFNLMADDFVNQNELIYSPQLEINNQKTTYFEGVGNNKLLRIHGQNEVMDYPLSLRVNTFSKEFVTSGKYVFELVNLRTNERKYRLININ